MSTRKSIHDVVATSDDLKKITAAIAQGIDATDIEEELRGLGLKVRLDTVDWNTFGTISIEGGENETGCIITLQLSRIEVGFDSMSVEHGGKS